MTIKTNNYIGRLIENDNIKELLEYCNQYDVNLTDNSYISAYDASPSFQTNTNPILVSLLAYAILHNATNIIDFLTKNIDYKKEARKIASETMSYNTINIIDDDFAYLIVGDFNSFTQSPAYLASYNILYRDELTNYAIANSSKDFVLSILNSYKQNNLKMLKKLISHKRYDIFEELTKNTNSLLSDLETTIVYNIREIFNAALETSDYTFIKNIEKYLLTSKKFENTFSYMTDTPLNQSYLLGDIPRDILSSFIFLKDYNTVYTIIENDDFNWSANLNRSLDLIFDSSNLKLFKTIEHKLNIKNLLQKYLDSSFVDSIEEPNKATKKFFDYLLSQNIVNFDIIKTSSSNNMHPYYLLKLLTSNSDLDSIFIVNSSNYLNFSKYIASNIRRLIDNKDAIKDSNYLDYLIEILKITTNNLNTVNLLGIPNNNLETQIKRMLALYLEDPNDKTIIIPYSYYKADSSYALEFGYKVMSNIYKKALRDKDYIVLAKIFYNEDIDLALIESDIKELKNIIKSLSLNTISDSKAEFDLLKKYKSNNKLNLKGISSDPFKFSKNDIEVFSNISIKVLAKTIDKIEQSINLAQVNKTKIR